MGSLMAGWDSPFVDPKTVNSERNRSFTKEEIENFRRLHKKCEEEEEEEEEEHNPPHTLSLSLHNNPSLESGKEVTRYFLPPYYSTTELESDVGSGMEKKTDDWWTRSNWAFLNEPPQEEIDVSSHKYASQYHVAELATKKPRHAN
ncbi:uncharacterized protein LOC131224810 [Magnolia sinica]|uniref:uncharacterized protein LOC131224810 n=1 Tax=Magnolia sinica TaxID=86752 RepID=UPI0026593E36|nr:uncharacterized protein LOC131224810 [Magnolia sinica]